MALDAGLLPVLSPSVLSPSCPQALGDCRRPWVRGITNTQVFGLRAGRPERSIQKLQPRGRRHRLSELPHRPDTERPKSGPFVDVSLVCHQLVGGSLPAQRLPGPASCLQGSGPTSLTKEKAPSARSSSAPTPQSPSEATPSPGQEPQHHLSPCPSPNPRSLL